MKIFLIAAGVVLTIVVIAFGIWFFIFNETPPVSTGNPVGTPLPTASSAPLTVNQPVPDQQASAGKQAAIAQSLLVQIQNPTLITLYGTVVVSTYALQDWGDENKGGAALLRYDQSQGWVLVDMGGGLWTVDALVTLGVPAYIAEQLVAGLQK